ncbi:hypothetical protein ACOI9X_06305 [Pseudomonas sp. P2757]|uniref:hypothetical protein n=1 Tax=unclassified Pseudomonas TaxID=196821 RepID=UPI003B5C27AD
MILQSNAVDAGLALVPVYPPEWITPVGPLGTADGGVSYAAFQPAGVKLIIEPITGLLNWIVAAYDVLTIFVNGVNTGVSKTIMPGEEGDRFLLLVLALWFNNGVNDVHYTVKRVSGNTDKSPTLKLLYNDPAPTVAVIHPPSIGPGQPRSITINVGYARLYDTVKLTIGIWTKTFNNPDPTKPITHTLTVAELLLIGDGVHRVSATVVDQLTNSGVSAATSIVISSKQPLSIDQSVLNLDGVMVRSGHCPHPNGRNASGNFSVRQASGGVEPYSYLTSNSYIASVSSQGEVVGMSNGRTIITAVDQNGDTVDFPVDVSNVFDVTIFHTSNLTQPAYKQLLAENSWIGMTPQIRAALDSCYHHPHFSWTIQPEPRANRSWTGVTSGGAGEVYDISGRLYTWDDWYMNPPYHGFGFWLKK